MSTLTVINDDSDFTVVYKPAGMDFHSQDNEPGLVAIAQQQLDTKFYPVHRLDKVTSGLVLLPKSSAAAATFTAMFSAHEVDKFYMALCTAKPKKKQGWIKGDMGKARRGAFKLLKTQENPAITRFYSYSLAPGLRGMVLKPFSGKTHQLRVAMKSLSAPILGDTLYGAEASDRTYLHAYALRFQYRDQHCCFCAPMQEGQHAAQLNTLLSFCDNQPWQLNW
ncbi:TIGR01621 family pseudouridine synthase [Pseudoalteromonas ruthenica]|uniref:TIGR01621 family pseudouridine synthase n=1 Tax=Pseudoalteromonas ruthenica TaxID=151081 RepID=UPI00110B77B9|nr:TIGR01621 family pseudouridine synthase [Pseudoalteromonas ruthenica]TMO47186.1 TIGR01621 family pseudouridine synthase [Pseudoalteromonas ruthenica]TMO51360.1 TIGR01621 family pseudouridine synthase [Pseudoalteromonas ruthenica]